MEADEIARRIRQIHDIETAMDESGEGRTPLTDAIRNAIPFMTPEEIRETLFHTLDMLDAQYRDRRARDEQARKKDEAHEREIANIEARHKAELEKERSARIRAERESLEKDREIESLKKDLEDEKNRTKTNTRNTFGSRSRRSRTAVGGGIDASRPKGKEGFDAENPEGASESVQPADTTGEGDKIMTEADVDAHNARNGMTYTMADASEKVTYRCDRGAIPEGWVIAEEGPIYRTLFDAKTTVTARRIEFVRIRRRIQATDEDGAVYWKWEYETIHFPFAGESLKKDTGVANEAPGTERQPYSVDNVPGKLGGTSTTPSLAAYILLNHFLCFTPVNRISTVFREFGFSKCRQGITDWVHKYAEMLRPAYRKLMDMTMRDNATLFMDETWARLHLTTGDRKVYEWIVGNKKEKCVFYFYDDGSRGRKVVGHLLQGRNIKAIHTDGYNAYFFLEGLGIVHIACTAHIWRYIMDWYNATHDGDARLLLLDISALYAIEAQIRGKSPTEILERRQSDEVTGILTKYKARLDLLKLKIDTLPGVGQTAVNYALKLFPNMARWREDADFDIDNNFAERAARPVAMSRKMQQHYASHKGAEASCIIRSMIETCKLWGKSVYEYLRSYFTAIARGRTDYDNLMPWSIEIGC